MTMKHMDFAGKFTRNYFNFAYNRVYDTTISKLNRYQELQRTCVKKLELMDNDRVLCLGLGTGNEVLRILEVNRNVDVVGVDHSKTALQKARRKALTSGKEIQTHLMDARYLDFPPRSFDKVLCIHLMDFVREKRGVTRELLRVLKKGGRFAVTYPSRKEGPRLGYNLLGDSVRSNLLSGRHRVRVFFELVARMMTGFVYLPLLLRPRGEAYSLHELQSMISRLTNAEFQIEEEPLYCDFIVYGRK
jgi:ubiquinone/menaquinone biosynthesis C-methylase UbiE